MEKLVAWLTVTMEEEEEDNVVPDFETKTSWDDIKELTNIHKRRKLPVCRRAVLFVFFQTALRNTGYPPFKDRNPNECEHLWKNFTHKKTSYVCKG
jgi:hypothetical protein